MASDISDLQKRIREFVDERDWDQFHNPKDLALSLILESAEVLEHFQWKNDAEMADYAVNHKDDIGEELADVLYWTLLLANKLKIDLSDAFKAKMLINEAKYPIEKAKGKPEEIHGACRRMIVYSASKLKFQEDVMSNDIAAIIMDAFKEKTGHSTGPSEITSWQNSLQYMERVLADGVIPNASGVAIEYHIPQSSKRIDFNYYWQKRRR